MGKNYFGFEPKRHDERLILPPRKRPIDAGGHRHFDSPENPLDKVGPGEVQPIRTVKSPPLAPERPKVVSR